MLSNIEEDKRLHDHYAPYIYQRKDFQTGGFEVMRRDLVLFLEQRGLSSDYGFTSRYATKEKDPHLGKPAISTATSKVAVAAKSKKESTPGFIAVCKYCLSEGHQLSECRKHERAGKPDLTSEQKDALKAKINALKGRGDATPKSEDTQPARGSNKTKSTNTAIKVISDDGTDKGQGNTTPKSKDHPAKGSAKTKTTNTAIKVISDDRTDKGQGNNKSDDERADILSKTGGGANFGARRDELVKKDPDLQDA